jgi:hypothetical protein
MPLNSPGSWTVLNSGLQPQGGLYCVMGFAFNSAGEALTGGSFCTGGPNGQYTAYPYRLIGNGTTWTVGNPGTPNWEAPVAQDGRGNILMKLQGNSPSLGYGVYVSTDGGSSYHPPTTNVVNSGIIFDIKLAPDNTTVYAGAELNGVFYSKDHGDNWSNLGPPPGQTGANTIAIGFAPNGTVLVSRESGQGVWCYLGPLPQKNWKPCNEGITGTLPRIWSFLTLRSGKILAASTTGVFASTDNGQTWSPAMSGLPSDIDARALAQDSQGFVYLGTNNDNGVYVSTNPQ